MSLLIALTGDVIEAFPQAQIRFVVARGLRNDSGWENADSLLSGLEQRVASGEWQPFDENSARIASWHDAYRKFGTNPRRLRPSADALGRRLARNRTLPRINGAVDAYNFVSVSNGLPAGAFDLRQLTGPVQIRFAAEGDSFVPLGEPDAIEHPGRTEVVYAMGDQVLTRHWNHRDCDQAKVTAQSCDVMFIIERLCAAAAPDDVMAKAQGQLAEIVQSHAAEISLASIEAAAPEAVLGFASQEMTAIISE